MVDKFYFHFTTDECKWLGLNVSKAKLLLFGILFGLKNVWPFVHTQTCTDTLYIYIFFFTFLVCLYISFTSFTKPWASTLLSEDQHIRQMSMVIFFICIAYLQCVNFFSTALSYQVSDWCTCCPAYLSITEYLICLHNSIFHRLSDFQTHQMTPFQRLDIYFFSASGLSVHKPFYFV